MSRVERLDLLLCLLEKSKVERRRLQVGEPQNGLATALRGEIRVLEAITAVGAGDARGVCGVRVNCLLRARNASKNT